MLGIRGEEVSVEGGVRPLCPGPSRSPADRLGDLTHVRLRKASAGICLLHHSVKLENCLGGERGETYFPRNCPLEVSA